MGWKENKKVDPWLKVDPWGYDASKTKMGVPVQPDLTLNLQQIEERIEQSVLAKMPRQPSAIDGDDANMGSDSVSAVAQHDERLEALESQVNRLMSGHQVLEKRLEDGLTKTEAHISQVQHQVAAQIDAQSSRMESLFQSQMSRLESLLSKKARME